MALNTHLFSRYLLFLGLICISSVSANNVEVENISDKLEVIQVAAFKKSKIPRYKNDLLKSFDVCTINDGKYVRFFIVNVQKNEYEKVLQTVKQIYPDAFNARKKIKKLIASHENSSLTAQLSGPRRDYNNEILNARSILQTHRNFF